MSRKMLLGAWMVALLFATGASAWVGPRVVPNSYIVQVEEGADVFETAAWAEIFTGGTTGHVYTEALSGFSMWVPPGITRADMVATPGVKLVEPDLVMHAMGQTLPTGVDRIEADADGVSGPVDVDIAIIDTGIDKDHPDLNVVGGTHFYTVNTGPPWERGANQDGNYDDDNGHGSHCAGIAAAIDNTEGVVGVAPGARLYGVKVLDSSGSGYMSDIIAGVDWVTKNAETIEVANMSLGGQGTSTSLRTAIQNSVGAGVVYVVSAGNDSADVYGTDGTFNTSDDYIPAAYPEVATISAMADSDGQPGGTGGDTSYGSDDSFATFSNYSGSVVSGNPVTSSGAAIDLLLPGVDIYSCYKDAGYATASGTSMSSPHAAGLAALYIAEAGTRDIAADGSLNEDDVYAIRQALIDGGVAQDSTQGLATLNDPDINWENIGWAGPLEPVTDIAVTSVAAPSSVVQGDLVSIDVTVQNVGNQDVTTDINVTLTDDTDGVTIGTQTISGGLAAGASRTLTYSWDTSGASPGDHTLTGSQDFTDDNTTNDSKSTVVTVESPLTDIAITAVSAPSSVVQGDVVSVDVTVENVGNQDVTSYITVTLTDDTDVVTIGTQTISGGLAAGASTTLTYSWDTTGASIAEHTLTGSHDFADDDASNNSKSTTVTVKEESVGVTVTGIDPDKMQAGTTESVTISGSGFASGASVTFENGAGPAPEASGVSVAADGTGLTASVTAKSGGPPKNRIWDVRVTNPDSSTGVLVGGFTVTP